MDYLKHTLSHIAGALAVLVVAVLVGYVARAQTASTTDPNYTSAGTASLTSVYFNAWKDGEVCVNGIMHYRYSFSITPLSGGYISLDGSIFVDDMHMNFQQTVAPGTHTWTGYARNGYALASGIASGGTVSIPSVACPPDGTASQTSTANTATVDTIAPATPTGLMAVGATGGGIKIAWNASTDNVGVRDYVVLRNETPIMETSQTYYHDIGVTPGVTYRYTVKARDMAGNSSAMSSSVTATAPTMTTSAQTTTTTKYVSLFTIAVTQTTECANGVPLTHVGFFVEPGGLIKVTRNAGSGFTISETDSGDRALPNDTYRWSGSARTDLGYALTSGGVYEGTFTLNAPCQTSETTFVAAPVITISTTTSTTTVVPMDDYVPGQPMMAVAMDPNTVNERYVSRSGYVYGSHVRFMIAAPFRAEKVEVFLGRSGTSIPLGAAFSVGPLSSGGYYGYAKDWDSTQTPDGEYAVIARAYRSATDIMPTDAFPIYVMNSKATLTNVSGPTAATTTTSPTTATAPVSSTGITTTTTTVTAPKTVTNVSTETVIAKPAPAPVQSEPATVPTVAPVLVRPVADLAPVDTKSGCRTMEECKVFCEQNADRIIECRDFARTSIIAELPAGSQVRSIAESLSGEVHESISEILRDPSKRPAGVPEEVKDSGTFAQYCTDPDHEALCGRVLVDHRVLTEEEFAGRIAEVKVAREEARRVITERTGTRAHTDSDGDGVTDYDEINLYATDPRDADTDNDGMRDGDELLAGTNPVAMPITLAASGTPLSATGSAKIDPTLAVTEEVRFENPKLAGVKSPEFLTVQKVEAADIETKEDGTKTAKSLALAGTALPNSFVRIFVFSEPIMVTVRADDDGVWTYTLDKELSDGQHEIYTAITDVSGKIVAKSVATSFVKTAEAVTIVPTETLLAAAPAPQASAPSFFSGTSLYALIAIGIGIIGIAISVIGFAVRRKDDADMGGPTVLPPASA